MHRSPPCPNWTASIQGLPGHPSLLADLLVGSYVRPSWLLGAIWHSLSNRAHPPRTTRRQMQQSFCDSGWRDMSLLQLRSTSKPTSCKDIRRYNVRISHHAKIRVRPQIVVHAVLHPVANRSERSVVKNDDPSRMCCVYLCPCMYT